MTSNDSGASTNRVKAVEKAFNIIECMQELQECSVRELATHMNIRLC